MKIERQSTEQRAAVLPGDPTVEYPFELPYGYRPAKGVLEPDEDEARVVREIFDKAAEGRSLNDIVDSLQGDGQAGGSEEGTNHVWTAESVARVLRDPVYVGEWNGIGAVTEQLIDRDVFERAQRVIDLPGFAFRGLTKPT